VLRIVGVGGDWGFPSPFAAVGGPGYWRMSYLYDTLVWKDGSGELLPWLAESFERSDDDLTYRFRLREGLTWSDGVPLSADDVAFTFEYFSRQSLAPFVLARPRRAPEVVTTGNLVEFHLTSPDVTFSALVGGAVPIVPRHIWEGIDDAAAVRDESLLVGSGPYRLESYSEPEGSYVYRARDDYFLGTPFVERIEMAPVGNQLQALLAGDLSAGEPATEGSRPDVLAPFRTEEAFEVIQADPGFTFPLFFNVGRGGALGDVRFRRACALAIDRNDMVERLLGGQGSPGSPGFLPPTHPAYVEVEQYGFDLDAANALLDDAGYLRGDDGARRGPDGQVLAFELLGFGVPFPPSVELVTVALAEIGVEITPRAVDGGEFFPRTIFGDYDMAISLFPGPSGGSVDGDPDILRQVFSSRLGTGPNRATGYSNPDFDDLAEQQLQTFDETQRRELVGRMQEILAADVPVLALYYPTRFFIFRPGIFDAWYFTPGGFATGIPETYNKHAFVTGARLGLEVRSSD
jgi:peptide/nickel transport system substrate-binding protein